MVSVNHLHDSKTAELYSTAKAYYVGVCFLQILMIPMVKISIAVKLNRHSPNEVGSSSYSGLSLLLIE